MILPFKMDIEKIEIAIKPFQLGNIKAFGELKIYDSIGNIWMKVRGITIKTKQFSSSSPLRLSVDFPAFPSSKAKSGFATSVIFEQKEVWLNITDAILREYKDQTGDPTVIPERLAENIDPGEIPF